MEYRVLGKTGLKVSEIGFGPEWIGGWEQQRVNDLLTACEDAGMNILDCWMADPAIREALGIGLEGRRDSWVIQGHIGSTWQDGQYVRTRDIEPVRQAFEDQLRSLRTDHVELGIIHYVDSVEEFQGIMDGGAYLDYVHELHEQGKIQHIGLSTHNPDVALLAVTYPEIEMIMFSVNPAFDVMPASDDINTLFGDFAEGGDGIDPARAAVYTACEKANVGITVMKGFAGGRLLDAEKSPFGIAMTPAQCINYALERPAVCSFLGGYTSIDQVKEAVAYYDAAPEERDYAHVLAAAPQHTYRGKCIYCGHCQPCVMGINIATVNKFYDLAVMQEEVPASVKAHYEALEIRAGDCIHCGSCEPNCPFGVQISDQMSLTEALFGC